MLFQQILFSLTVVIAVCAVLATILFRPKATKTISPDVARLIRWLIRVLIFLYAASNFGLEGARSISLWLR